MSEENNNNALLLTNAQKLDDFMREARDRWVKQDEDIEILKAFMSRVDTPVKAVLWALGLISAAILTGIGFGIVSWVRRHLIV